MLGSETPQHRSIAFYSIIGCAIAIQTFGARLKLKMSLEVPWLTIVVNKKRFLAIRP